MRDGRRRHVRGRHRRRASPRRTRGSPTCCAASTAPVLLVANKVDDTSREATSGSSSSSVSATRSRSSALHGRGTGDLLDALVAALPDGRPVDGDAARRRRRRRGPRCSRSRSSGGPTSASRRCSTGSSARTGRSCTTCRAPPATPSTPSSRPTRARSASSTPRACAASRRSTRAPSTTRSSGRSRPSTASDVALLVIDATEGITAPGPAAGRAHRRRRLPDRRPAQQVGDCSTPSSARGRDYAGGRKLHFIGERVVLKISALTGKGVHKLLPALGEAIEAYHTPRPDPEGQRGDPGRAVGAARRRTGPACSTPRRARPTRPPSRCSPTRSCRRTYLRYLERRLREAFDLGPTPIKLRVRRRSE